MSNYYVYIIGVNGTSPERTYKVPTYQLAERIVTEGRDTAVASGEKVTVVVISKGVKLYSCSVNDKEVTIHFIPDESVKNKLGILDADTSFDFVNFNSMRSL